MPKLSNCSIILFIFSLLSISVARAQYSYGYNPIFQVHNFPGAEFLGVENVAVTADYRVSVDVKNYCTPSSNGGQLVRADGIVTAYAGKKSNGQYYISFMPLYGQFGSTTSESVEVFDNSGNPSIQTFSKNNYINVWNPTLFEVQNQCTYAHCPDGPSSCEYSYIYRYKYFGANIALSERPSDLKVDSIQVTGPGISPDGEGGYIIERPKPGTIPQDYTITAKVSGAFDFDEIQNWNHAIYTLIVTTGDHSTAQLIDGLKLYREGSVEVTQTLSGFDWWEGEPTAIEVGINTLGNLTEVNYSNNYLRVPVKEGKVDKKISVKGLTLAQVVLNPEKSHFDQNYIFESSEALILPDYEPLPFAETKSFTAVLGKSLDFQPEVAVSGGISEGNFSVIVKSGNAEIWRTQKIPFNILPPGGGAYKIPLNALRGPVLAPYIPKDSGIFHLSVEVEVESSEQVEKVGMNGFTLDVVKTYTPITAVYKLKYGNTEVAPNNFDRVLSAQDYYNDILPISDNSLSFWNMGQVSSIKNTTKIAQQLDLMQFEVRRLLSGFDRAIVVVPPSYMQFGGFWYPSIPGSMLVQENRIATVAHELLHSFGVKSELYNQKPGQITEGLNARTGDVYNTTSVSDTGPYDGNLSHSQLRWMDNRNYSFAFRYLSQPLINTRIVLLTGIVNSDGSTSNVNIYKIDNNTETISETVGGLVVKGLDSNGNIVVQKNIPASFTNSFLAEGETVGTSIPFAVRLRDDSRIAKVEVFSFGRKVISSSKNGLAITGLIERIPLASFKDGTNLSPEAAQLVREKQKDFLRQLATNAKIEMDKNNKNRANAYLTTLITQIKAFTNASYSSSDPYDVSQSFVVNEINLIIRSL
ncbi:hypothetical protein [Bdellovibrio sp. KM01]|uniref:hypothetical protein n=1 Tax=Bdellovibrio sp. KM01 TaxID=2748865 RepID=UPI0015E97784|nr:hypothetical protein [Bdellovibrio sp. KM01]QLY23863.1 hypothetical protein HW988_10185 [Bdellovibrio sp. KM01]